jgi:hypothetical protein
VSDHPDNFVLRLQPWYKYVSFTPIPFTFSCNFANGQEKCNLKFIVSSKICLESDLLWDMDTPELSRKTSKRISDLSTK